MALEGKQLGRYRIMRLLGSGGMGEVYLAEDPRIKQQVAIKVIRAEQSPYPNAPSAQTAVRLFQREARAIVALDHPHILPLHDYGEEQQGKTSLIWLVMPYRPEGSLVDYVQQRYPDCLVPPHVVDHLVSQAAEALQHAHDHQIIHMDVKPSNFLLRANPKTPDRPDLLLSDFGIARLGSATASTSQAIRGTPTYMAPEQCEGEAVPASDQYALAVMTYELLTGRPPFQGNAMRLMYQHVNTPPEPPSAYNPHLSKALDDMLLTALSKRPEERFASVTAFATAFQQAVQAMEVADASTLISAAPMSKITSALPNTPPISDTLAEAPTKITPPAEIAAPAVSGPIGVDTSAPAAQGWAAATTEPTAPPLPETVDLGQRKESSSSASPALQSWTEETGAPTAPPLPKTLSLGAGEAANTADGEAGVKRSGPVEAPVPTPSEPMNIRGRKRRSRQRFILIAAAILVILALVAGGGAYAVLGTTATVTITPASQDVSNTYTISAVTGTPDASKQQVGARMLSVTTTEVTKTVNATGTGIVPGTGSHASGTLDVHINLNQSVTFYAGAIYSNDWSGCNVPRVNIHMVLDTTFTIDSTSGPNYVNSVPAHVLEVGTIGNLPMRNADTCISFSHDGCATDGSSCGYISIASNFAGGQDPQTYTTVAQSDINNAAKALESADQPNPQQVLQSQIQSNEQQVGTPKCKPNVTADHKAGDKATQVTVSVTFTCTGEVYDHDAAVAIAANLLTQQAATDPGGGYALVGKITATIPNATADNTGAVTLTVSAEGTWAYQFTDAQKQSLARLIGGKSVQEAQQLLDSQPGIEKATIQLSGIGQTLPTDPTKIKIVVQAVAGA